MSAQIPETEADYLARYKAAQAGAPTTNGVRHCAIGDKEQKTVRRRGPSKFLTQAQQDVVDAIGKGYTTSPEIAPRIDKTVANVATLLTSLSNRGYVAKTSKRGQAWAWSVNYSTLPARDVKLRQCFTGDPVKERGALQGKIVNSVKLCGPSSAKQVSKDISTPYINVNNQIRALVKSGALRVSGSDTCPETGRKSKAYEAV